MFELDIERRLTVISATENDAYFVRIMFIQNKEILNADNISLKEWKEILGNPDPYEKHFIICKGAMPVAYMKINGLENKDTAFVSMLFVSTNYHRMDIGSFALKYAEDYVYGKGFLNLAIKTDKDNLPAQNCYIKNKYTLVEKGDKYKYIKDLRSTT